VLFDEQHAAAAVLVVLEHNREQPLHDDRREAEAELIDQQPGLPGERLATASICCSPPESSPTRRPASAASARK
jgi:hypothetical protein